MSDVMNLNEQTLYLRNKELEAEVTELREAIKTHKDSFIGDEGDICTEDDRLWALLEVKGG